MVLALGEQDSSFKRKCQALANFRDKAKDAQHAERSKARLLGICLTLL